MGMFSWIDVTGDENICYSDDKVICLIPEEHRDAVSKVFGIELGKTGVVRTNSIKICYSTRPQTATKEPV